MKSFASDNYAGVLPEVMQALQNANNGHARSYGADDITALATQKFREVFGAQVEVLFVFNGTGANVLSLSAATQSFNSVLCADIAHIVNDESSAPETFTGCRFYSINTNKEGKLDPKAVAKRIIRKGDIHFPQVNILSVTQSTEYGTLYTPDELRALSAICREHNIYFHIDGSRFFNAAAGLGLELKDISTQVGCDILSLGGTKLGMMFGEAVVVFNPELAKYIRYKQKQAMQLASKTRYIAAQFMALLTDDLWKKTAQHSNAMAQLLYKGLQQFPQIKVGMPVQANVVFAQLPLEWNEPLMEQFPFYIWKDEINEARLMCAWDTTEEDIDRFIGTIATLTGN